MGTKKKKKRERDRENTSDGRVRPRDLWRTKTRALPPSYRHQLLQTSMLQNIYLHSIWRLGPSTFDLRNPTIPILM